MLINVSHYIFIIIALLLAIMLICYKLWVYKINDTNMAKSNYMAGITGLFFLFSILAFIIAIITPGLKHKLILLIIAASPFIIGELATYKTEKFYSIIQVLIILGSICYIISI